MLIADGDFSSIVLPFVHAGRALRVRTAPLAALADAIRADTALVAFSLVQSATGEVADAAAIVAAAQRVGARTLCDATQAVGWLPVAASDFDAVICHAYKWLCAPRGVSFLAVSERLAARMTPLFAGWYAGEDPVDVVLRRRRRRSRRTPGGSTSRPRGRRSSAPSRRSRCSPSLDPHELHDHAVGLAARSATGWASPSPERPSAIVTWADPDGCDLARLTAAGITASGRAGRARVAFHVFNDDRDVDLALAALGR